MTEQSQQTINALTMKSIQNIEKSIEEIKVSMKDIKDNYVRREEFNTVRNITFGLVGLIVTSVILALMASIIQ